MANVLFTRTSDPNSKPVTDGQLIFDTSGNGKMYLDNGTDRLEMGGALTVDATLSKTSTNPVQNKAVAGVMLDTLSDIGNVTSKGFLTDALAVKELNTNVNELNNSLGGFTPIIDSTGKITGYKTKVGADTVFPFSSLKYGTFDIPSYTETQSINCGFKPKSVIVICNTTYNMLCYKSDAIDRIYFAGAATSSGITLTNTGFDFCGHKNGGDNWWNGQTVYYLAFGSDAVMG